MLYPDLTEGWDEDTLAALEDFDPLKPVSFGEAKGLPPVDAALLVSQDADAGDFHESDLDGAAGFVSND